MSECSRNAADARHARTRMLIGEDAVERLRAAHVIVFGLGGVGGSAAEALARAGIGTMTVVDNDVVDITNLNRQVIALGSTIGEKKTSVMGRRIRDIDPDIRVIERETFFLPDNSGDFDFGEYDYIIDAVDTVTAKLEIVTKAAEAGIRVISSMGTGNKLHPEMFMIADIEKTSVCPLAKVMRRELRERGIRHLKVVYSKEQPVERTNPPGSISFVPPAAGMIMAGEVIRDLMQEQGAER